MADMLTSFKKKFIYHRRDIITDKSWFPYWYGDIYCYKCGTVTNYKVQMWFGILYPSVSDFWCLDCEIKENWFDLRSQIYSAKEEDKDKMYRMIQKKFLSKTEVEKLKESCIQADEDENSDSDIFL